MKTRIAWTVAGISLVCCGVLSYNKWIIQKENQRLTLINSIQQAEYRILKDEISELNGKPTYDQGYKAALLRVGGPQTPGAYQDGWDDAMKMYMDSSYADGYHNAIAQFGYTKTAGMCRFLVPEPKGSNGNGYLYSGTHPESDIEPIPVKLEE